MRSRFGVRFARFIAIAVIAAAGFDAQRRQRRHGRAGHERRHGPEAARPEPVALVHGRRLRDLPDPVRAPRRASTSTSQPAPGFADEWSSSEDLMTHTFHIREGMLWSDGQPATCADAEYTYNFVLEAVASDRGYVGSGYLEPYLTNTGLESVECDGPNTLIAHTAAPVDAADRRLHPDPAEARLVAVLDGRRSAARTTRTSSPTSRRSSAPARTSRPSWEPGSVHPHGAQPELLGRAGRRRTRSSSRCSPDLTPWSRPSRTVSSTTSAA